MVICFFGHKKVYNEENIKKRLEGLLMRYVSCEQVSFMIGMRGDFDNICFDVCKSIKNDYSNIEINVVISKLSLLISSRCEKDYDVLQTKYQNVNNVSYPIEEEHFKQQIIKNNKYMVDDSDLIICYIDPNKKKSGAKIAVDYALKKKKKVINIFMSEDKIFNKKSKEELNDIYNKILESKKSRGK